MIGRKKVESQYVASIDTSVINSHLFTDYKVRESELALIIEREVAALPQKMPEVFLMSRNDHLSHKEIADKLGISETTVSRQISNALKILRTRLGLILYIAFLLRLK
jgi:RNA polymerase sigma factor (sigma-70 family)